ncbi:hypothetical protein JCM10207_000326 [Rhodosporidiobolus poonsookiae]
MARLSTQPDTAKALPLRSGFYALPLASSSLHLFVRLHKANAADEDDTEGAAGSHQLFVTGLPLGASAKGVKSAMGKIWGEEVKVKSVELLPAPPVAGAVFSLYQQQLAVATAAVASGDDASSPSPLLDLSAASSSSSIPPPHSALVTFSSSPALPPPPYPASTPLTLPSAQPFLAASAARHALARPHRSAVIAHADEWMRAYDQRKIASAPIGYLAPDEAQAGGKKAKKGKKSKDVGPLPGSAAAALASYHAQRAKLQDKGFNPDEADEGEWTTVQRGGRHGKSLLPAGVVPTLSGYGGVNVKVAGKKRGRVEEEDEGRNDAGIKKIVGEGFYRFNKAEGRRRELSALKAKFEEDKARVDRLRSSGPGKMRGGGRGGFGGGKRGRAFKPY